jgi:hypothetical protein
MRDRAALLDDATHQFQAAVDSQTGVSVQDETSVHWVWFLDSSTPRTEVSS